MKFMKLMVLLALFPGCQPTTRVSEQQARQIASDYVNSFLSGKTYEVDGREFPYPEMLVQAAGWHEVKRTANGWSLKFDPLDGCYARVEMDLNGENVRVTEHGFSPD
jgi:hypothetical protein